MHTTNDRRIFPAECTSAFCGRSECAGCSSKPRLDEFKAWRERTGAIIADEIWSPTVWVAQRAAD